ncbi:MAG: hypothetical protein NDP24_01075 [Crenarchaeota archaeon]|nr:hypothetical protein [Thermoproteota archaeon]
MENSEVRDKSPTVAGLSYSQMLERALEAIPKATKVSESSEMPQFEIERETHRTIVLNWGEIIDKYKIDEKLLLRFLQKRLGTIGMPQHGRLYLQGSFTKARLNKLLETFIKEYVVCDVCGRPHGIIIKEGGRLIKKCTACGAWRAIEKP